MPSGPDNPARGLGHVLNGTEVTGLEQLVETFGVGNVPVQVAVLNVHVSCGFLLVEVVSLPIAIQLDNHVAGSFQVTLVNARPACNICNCLNVHRRCNCMY